MDYTSIFERHEIKFLCKSELVDRLIYSIEPEIKADKFPHGAVRSLYYDTPSFRLIRRSIERPIYKEKLRLRCYNDIDENSTVFVELKKKYKGIVYKRRVALPYSEAKGWLGGGRPPEGSQIVREIEYFRRYYEGLMPSAYLTYSRDAFVGKSDKGLRLTFDRDVRADFESPSLLGGMTGEPVLPSGFVLFELKTPVGIPLWLTESLSRLGIYKTSFSKYGEAYTNYVKKKEIIYA